MTYFEAKVILITMRENYDYGSSGYCYNIWCTLDRTFGYSRISPTEIIQRQWGSAPHAHIFVRGGLSNQAK